MRISIADASCPLRQISTSSCFNRRLSAHWGRATNALHLLVFPSFEVTGKTQTVVHDAPLALAHRTADRIAEVMEAQGHAAADQAVGASTTDESVPLDAALVSSACPSHTGCCSAPVLPTGATRVVMELATKLIGGQRVPAPVTRRVIGTRSSVCAWIPFLKRLTSAV